MERLRCPTCGNEVFFDSMRCVRCATELALDVGDDGRIDVADLATTVGCCRRAAWRCNWQAHDTDGPACPSCRIVDVPDDARTSLLVPFVAAQRRALWQLSSLGVGWRSDPSLRFVYRSRSAGDHAVIGHLGGQISLDLDEADPARGEQIRATLGEQYRTPLGHIRHELGHYVWLRLVASDPERLVAFRRTFGDETADYQAALERHYARTDDGSWRGEHVSFYASAHPWEDFAESWAQVMHIHDVVSTGAAWNVIPAPPAPFDPATWVSAAVTASLAANELARSMGMRDLYPFALSPGARRRIDTAWRVTRPMLPADRGPASDLS